MEEVVEQLSAVSKTVSAAGKAWNRLSSVVNPCAVVETEGTLSKAKAKSKASLGRVNLSRDSTVGVNAKIAEQTTGTREEEQTTR